MSRVAAIADMKQGVFTVSCRAKFITSVAVTTTVILSVSLVVDAPGYLRIFVVFSDANYDGPFHNGINAGGDDGLHAASPTSSAGYGALWVVLYL